MIEALFNKKLENNLVQCKLCNHFCVIKEQGVGTCSVRKNITGELYSLVYGYPVALNIDPVEKKPLYHFQPGSLTFSLGTYGCNFKCLNCQNWDISQAKNIEEKIKSLEFIPPEKIIAEALGNDCKSISYTYNEPTIFTEYALAIMKLAKQNNLNNIWVSNGFMSTDCLNSLIPYLDAINIDLKSMSEEFYKSNCQSSLKPILNNIKILKQEQIHLEITTLIIPGLSDDLEMLKNLAEYIFSELDADIPWHLSKFSPKISWELKKIPATRDDILYTVYEIGKDVGLKYIYLGNMPGDTKENTYCPKCHELAIRRLGYQIERLDNKGRCAHCDKNLDIIE
ncbi:MAG: AmmeMemoRadiSam system radical SAM enzyme [Patescibacteria group bacterium]